MKIIGMGALTLILGCNAYADFSYKDSSKVRISNPKLIESGKSEESTLDKYKVVDLSANVEVGSSCGEMNISKNLRANLKDLLDDDFFKGLGNKIQDAGGMLALCYLSPSYCAIAKHMRLSSHYLSQLNLDSCALIDKYVDNRVSDYEMSKQQCVRRTLEQNGQDVKAALEKCGGRHDLGDWAGASNRSVETNALIASSAEWAGLRDAEASRVVDLTKAFVGDTVLARGGLQIEFGQRKKLTSPRELIAERAREAEHQLADLVENAERGSSFRGKDIEKNISEVFGSDMDPEISRQTVRSLAYMPYKTRELAIRRLARAFASKQVIQDAEKSMEVLQLAARNPNLPPHRQQEALAMREQLKQSLDLTLEMRAAESEEVAKVLASIQDEGGRFEAGVSRRNLEGEASVQNRERIKSLFFDCSDSVFCGEGN